MRNHIKVPSSTLRVTMYYDKLAYMDVRKECESESFRVISFPFSH